MADITEHDSVQEGESDDGKDSRVGFFVGRHAVSVDDVLEDLGDLVHAEVARRLDVVLRYKFECGHFDVLVLFLDSLYHLERAGLLTLRNPTETHKQLVTLLKLVQRRKQLLFFRQKDLVQLNQRDVVLHCLGMLRYFLDFFQELPQSTAGRVNQVRCILNSSLYFCHFSCQLSVVRIGGDVH